LFVCFSFSVHFITSTFWSSGKQAIKRKKEREKEGKIKKKNLDKLPAGLSIRSSTRSLGVDTHSFPSYLPPLHPPFSFPPLLEQPSIHFILT
jgi:hypothetical protein